MGSCASTGRFTKPNRVSFQPPPDANPEAHEMNAENASAANIATRLYDTYPDAFNHNTLGMIQVRYPDATFVKYYTTKAEEHKRQGEGRDVLQLHTYDHKDITVKAPQHLKKKLMTYLQENNKVEAQKMLNEGIKPNESIGKPGKGETVFHYLAKNNNYEMIVCLIDWVKNSKTPEELDVFLNIPDSEGNTPLMVATFCDASESLYSFLLSGATINYELMNNAGLKLVEISEFFGGKCKDVLTQAKFIAETASKKKGDLMSKLKSAALFMEAVTKKIEIVQEKPEEVASKARKELRFTAWGRTEESFNMDTFSTGFTKYKEIIQSLSEKNEEFVDEDFPQDTTSLGLIRLPELSWKRDYEIVEKEKGSVKVLGKVSKYDILPGHIKTRMAPILQALTLIPGAIQSLFNTKEANPQGVYSVTLFNKGYPNEVIVDNSFPIDPETQKPLFFRAVGKKFWPLVLSKALAKYNISFDKADTRLLEKIISDLTPMPFWTLKIPQDGDMTMFENQLHKITSEDTLTFFSTSERCLPLSDRIRPRYFYQLVEVRKVSNQEIIYAKNLSGRDTDVFQNLTDFKANVGEREGFTEEALNDGLFPLKSNGFRDKVNHIYIFPKIANAKYTCLLALMESHHAEYYEFEITKEIKGLFKFGGGSCPSEVICLRDIDTNPTLICKITLIIASSNF